MFKKQLYKCSDISVKRTGSANYLGIKYECSHLRMYMYSKYLSAHVRILYHYRRAVCELVIGKYTDRSVYVFTTY